MYIKLINKIPLIYKLLKPLIILLCSILFRSIFSIANFLSFVPNKNKYTADVSIYTVILGIILVIIETWMSNERISIETLFSTPEGEIIRDHCEIIVADGEQYSRFSMTIKLEGNLKKISDQKLILSLPSWVILQTRSRPIVGTVLSNSYSVKLCDIVDTSAKTAYLKIDFLIIKDAETEGKIISYSKVEIINNRFYFLNELNNLELHS